MRHLAHAALFFILMGWGLTSPAQTGQVPHDPRQPETPVTEDTAFATLEPMRGGAPRFNLVFNMGFLLNNNVDEAAPTLVTSGTTALGLSVNFNFNPTWSIRAQPQFAWYKFYFRQTEQKSFPSPSAALGGGDYESELLRSLFIELPVGVGVVLSRNDRGRPSLWAEAGPSIGFLLGSTYKVRGGNIQQPAGALPGSSQTLISTGLPEVVAPVRLGAYARITYKFIGLWAYYRATPFFKEDARYTAPGGEERALPKLGNLELGVSIIL